MQPWEAGEHAGDVERIFRSVEPEASLNTYRDLSGRKLGFQFRIQERALGWRERTWSREASQV